MEQISFSDADYAAKKKVTRREKLLWEMEQIVPWQVLLNETGERDPEMHQYPRKATSGTLA